MAIAAHETREDKLKWLCRPIDWASSVAFYSTTFGFVFWYFGIWEAQHLVPVLCACLGVTSGLLIWAVARLTNAARWR
jgi:hypothetical protein